MATLLLSVMAAFAYEHLKPAARRRVPRDPND